MKKINSFTLVELLVVVTIISILAALLLPVLKSARDEAKKAVCLSNMWQWGIAVLMYTQDYDGYLPVPFYDYTEYSGSNYPNAISGWMRDELLTYGLTRQLFYCPVCQWDNDDDHWGTGGSNRCSMGLCYLAYFAYRENDGVNDYSIDSVSPTRDTDGAQWELFGDWIAQTGAGPWNIAHYGIGIYPGGGMTGNILYLDGHGKRKLISDMAWHDIGETWYW